MYIEKRMECSAFFCKRMKHSRILSRSLKKNGTIVDTIRENIRIFSF